MKSLERRFNNNRKKYPSWSDYVCFAEAVRRQGFSRDTIRRWFNRLVDKNEYNPKGKKNILTNLEAFTNEREDNQKSD